MPRITAAQQVNPLDQTAAAKLQEIGKDVSFRVETPVNNETEFTATTDPFFDEENDNQISIWVTDSEGKKHLYTTGQLGLTSNRYGAWCNVAYLV